MRLTCPVSTCRAENAVQAEVCVRCGIPLHGYARLSAYSAYLFNQGLSAARNNQVARARDYFAAVVHWCPIDGEARNALAITCYALGDLAEARLHWETVLERLPTDALATQGIAALTEVMGMKNATNAAKPRSTNEVSQHPKPLPKKKHGYPKKRR